LKIVGFCDKDTAVGLRLAGLQELYIPKDEPVKTWLEISDKDDIGVIFITENLAKKIEKYLKDFRIQKNIPIVVEIPDKKGRIKDHMDFISHLIKKAVGIEVEK
jgi:V/A-type H+-transporting ATPase subunit F